MTAASASVSITGGEAVGRDSLIRVCRREDLMEVAGLRRRLFARTRRTSDEDLAEYLRKIFFDNPWYDPDLPSLVLEANSRLVGFLGVLPRRFDGARRGALLTQLVVEPEFRRRGPSRLIRAAVNGPQQLTYFDAATEGVVRLWNRHFGEMSAVYRFFWTQPLWKSRLARSPIRGGPVNRAARATLQGVARAAERAGRRLAARDRALTPLTVRIANSGDLTSALSAADLYPIHVQYDAASFTWILDQARTKWGMGAVHALVLKSNGSPDGCFVLILRADGTAQVLYAVAPPDLSENLMDAIIATAQDLGAAEVEGRYDPILAPVAQSRGLTFLARGFGVGVASQDSAVMARVLSGQALLTGLDGEWLIDC